MDFQLTIDSDDETASMPVIQATSQKKRKRNNNRELLEKAGEDLVSKEFNPEFVFDALGGTSTAIAFQEENIFDEDVDDMIAKRRKLRPEQDSGSEVDQEDGLSDISSQDQSESVESTESQHDQEDQSLVDNDYFDQLATGTTTEALPSFASMPGAKLSRPILLALSSMGLTTATPIQAQTIPVVLLGKDCVGSSVTGSGKTVAFWVGVLERLLHRDKRNPQTRVVCLCPTRELAAQVHAVGQALARHTDITFCLCVGGLSLKGQEAELKQRPDVVVATPGRLIDHVRNSSSFSMDALEVLIIDEADRILEEGFKDELSEIVQYCPHNRSTLLFSATITEDVSELARLSLNKPVRIKIDDLGASSATLTQEFLRIRSDTGKENSKTREATLIAVCRNTFHSRTIVFTRSKQSAHRLKIVFGLCGLSADELHGDLSQEKRLHSLQRFKDGQVNYLIATDLASRGLDIKGVDYVVNFQLPVSTEIYLHRVGRTARAGKTGRSLTLVGEADRKMVKQILKKANPESIKQRKLDPSLVQKAMQDLDGLEDDIVAVNAEEKEEKALKQTEMELKKSENLIKHAAEIKGRPARTWFQSGRDKKNAKEADKASKPSSKPQRFDKKLNHKQRRRQEALQDAKQDSRKSKTGNNAAIRSVKKAAQAPKMRKLADPRPPPAKKPKKGKSKPARK